MTIKRLRNVAAATFVLLIVVFFFAQQHPKLPEAYRFRLPYGSPWRNSTDTGTPPSSQTSEAPATWPSQSDLKSPTNDLYNDSPSHKSPVSEHDPSLKDALPSPSHDQKPPSATESSTSEFKPEFLFQNDLDLHLPVDKFKEFASYPPHLYNPNGPKTYAYATFMATHNPSVKDPYYMAIHSLIYRILWSPSSRTLKYPLIVFVAEFITPEQRQLLAGAGAIVRELPPLEWNPNVPGVQHRWKDLFAKLNMWSQTEFERILFLDADAFPVTNIDDMFDMAPMQNCIDSKLDVDDYLPDGSNACEPYVFAGVPQNPLNETDININVGSMVFTPSAKMHQRLLQNYVKTDQYNCLMAEQAFLNWQFNINGAFPGSMLEREWGGFFPMENEAGKLKVVHEKLWSWSDETSWLKKEWIERWTEMLLYYMSTEFEAKRRGDGLAVL